MDPHHYHPHHSALLLLLLPALTQPTLNRNKETFGPEPERFGAALDHPPGKPGARSRPGADWIEEGNDGCSPRESLQARLAWIRFVRPMDFPSPGPENSATEAKYV
ncbi:hypothetical protein kuro4_28040 [Gelria sp. Kuro-4]|nr:hypothetical protein kuro4_28040 [Gelria sp. Kuro-4]